VLQDRILAEPDIDLNDYRCRAVIDWIDIRLHTAAKHQAVNLHRFAKQSLINVGSESTVFVSGANGETGFIGNEFTFRIQQPEPQALIDLFKALVAKYDPDRDTILDLPITGVEVSIDFYVKNQAKLDPSARDLLRWRMTDLLRRHLKPKGLLTEAERNSPRYFTSFNGQGGARFFVSNSTTKIPPRQSTEAKRLGVPLEVLPALRLGSHNKQPVDTTVYVGGKVAPVMLRVMDKSTDRRDPDNNAVVQLRPEQWRSRVEVTLRTVDGAIGVPAAVGLSQLQDLFGFEFKQFRKLFFEYFLPTFGADDPMSDLPFPVNVTEEKVFNRSGVYGLDQLHRSVQKILGARYRKKELGTKPVKLHTKGRLVSYTALNNKIDRALRGLSSRWLV